MKKATRSLLIALALSFGGCTATGGALAAGLTLTPRECMNLAEIVSNMVEIRDLDANVDKAVARVRELNKAQPVDKLDLVSREVRAVFAGTKTEEEVSADFLGRCVTQKGKMGGRRVIGGGTSN